uniref:Uncharacterized protein n=1 Tax=Chromera velia CCMP2878 TaxID=1169474 RepID=A0A0G4F0R2_9ALVE|eukprot:Cvel_2606.t1-p1 / transcript=Cvel_2606.t1 / gene=Cvel_2606 / organism=Chromera_velia_CCMP2878 / gene_product=hypothetical protein / transcript_product=hypothetical protein / location=Cvel_scaffold103:32686-35931(-) / protein_length=223 / sequence_SO=supercontig / SO=protein_coding / is_pseudo=false
MPDGVWIFPGSFPFPNCGVIPITPGGRYDTEDFRCSWDRNDRGEMLLWEKFLQHYNEALSGSSAAGVRLYTLEELENQLSPTHKTEAITLRWFQPLFAAAGLKTSLAEDPLGSYDLTLRLPSSNQFRPLRIQVKTSYRGRCWCASRLEASTISTRARHEQEGGEAQGVEGDEEGDDGKRTSKRARVGISSVEEEDDRTAEDSEGNGKAQTFTFPLDTLEIPNQ